MSADDTPDQTTAMGRAVDKLYVPLYGQQAGGEIWAAADGWAVPLVGCWSHSAIRSMNCAA